MGEIDEAHEISFHNRPLKHRVHRGYKSTGGVYTEIDVPVSSKITEFFQGGSIEELL